MTLFTEHSHIKWLLFRTLNVLNSVTTLNRMAIEISSSLLISIAVYKIIMFFYFNCNKISPKP